MAHDNCSCTHPDHSLQVQDVVGVFSAHNFWCGKRMVKLNRPDPDQQYIGWHSVGLASSLNVCLAFMVKLTSYCYGSARAHERMMTSSIAVVRNSRPEEDCNDDDVIMCYGVQEGGYLYLPP